MKKSTLRTMMCAVAAVGILAVQQRSMAAPAIYTWNQTAAGPFSWDYVASDNWDQSVGEPNTTYPDGAGQTANITTALTANQTINVPAGGVTVGTLTLGATSGTSIYTLQGGPITMDAGGLGASINRNTTGGTNDQIRVNIVMNEDLTINIGTGKTVRQQSAGSITGNHNLIINGVTGNTGTFYIDRANGYTGTTTVARGKLQLSGGNANNCIPGDLTINSVATLQNLDANAISTSALLTVNGTWNTGGNADSPGALAGAGSIATGGAIALGGAASAPNADFGGTISDGSPLTISMPITSSQTLSGTAANATGAVIVNSGHLVLNKGPVTGGGGVNAIATSLTINGGEVKLLQPEQISDTAPVTFAGGTFNSNGLSETLATLTNGGASTIDMGAGASILTFANSNGQTWTGSIQILNWSGLTAGGGTDQLIFGSDSTGLSGAQLGQISFINPSNYAPGTYPATILSNGEVVALVPEPAILGMLAASGLLALRRRRTRA